MKSAMSMRAANGSKPACPRADTGPVQYEYWQDSVAIARLIQRLAAIQQWVARTSPRPVTVPFAEWLPEALLFCGAASLYQSAHSSARGSTKSGFSRAMRSTIACAASSKTAPFFAATSRASLSIRGLSARGSKRL